VRVHLDIDSFMTLAKGTIMLIRCFLFGHKWSYKAWSTRTIMLAHLSPLAGVCAQCKYCNQEWCDIPLSYTDQSGHTHVCNV
jgi:hypothetical protein